MNLQSSVGQNLGRKIKEGRNIIVRRNVKKLSCAILCTCLLLINTPGAVSYAGNMEQYATGTDAAYVEVEDPAQVATSTDAEDNTSSATATDALLYATSPNVPEGGDKIEINSQADWDNLSTYTEDKNPVAIILNTDVKLSKNTSLIFPPTSSGPKNFLLYGNGYSIDIDGHTFAVQQANTVAIENTHIKNGTMQVQGHISFSCADSQFSSASLELNTTDAIGSADITKCKFINCLEPCVYSNGEACPASFSDCTMEYCGLLFKAEKKCEVSFSGIIATNCMGTVFGQTEDADGKLSTDSYTIKSISGCELSTSKPGVTAINYGGTGNSTANRLTYVGYDIDAASQISGCTIKGFDTGINLNNCEIVVKECNISDCKDGINIQGAPVVIVDTTLEARASLTDSVGVTSNSTCYLIDCDINDFVTGSDMSETTIISCKYQSKDTNLICNSNASVYDTRFIGGKNSVIMKNGTSYFYGCIVKGDDTTQSGFSMDGSSVSELHIYSLDRPYYSRSDRYSMLKNYSKRITNMDDEWKSDGKSEISNCTIGVDFAKALNIGDTHIHDCVTGIKTGNTTSWGNNLVEKCTDGMIVNQLTKMNRDTFTDIHTDTIRNCSNNGLDSNNITSTSGSWNDRLEIYDCDNYGINVKGSLEGPVDIHDCKTGIYMTETANNVRVIGNESKIYNNHEWNICNNSSLPNPQVVISSSVGTLIGGAVGNNIYSQSAVFTGSDLYSDDSVYYLGTNDGMYIFGIRNLYGTVVFDTIDSGYTLGRKVAVLFSPDIASQMFAKREGYVISTEKEGSTTYAIFVAGSDVTYDVTTNGGDTFDGEKLSDEEIENGKLPKISYLDGTDIDFSSHDASKDGYEFVGWNTDKDATVGLEVDTLTAGTEDITLYAIYKRNANVNYHTYDATLDYTIAVALYNNQNKVELATYKYNAGGDKTFAGYVLDEDATISSADDLLQAGDNVTVSPDGLDVYCVYEKQGQLTYLKKNGTTLSTESKTVYEICSENKEFEYTVRAGEPVAGFTFTGWKDEAGNTFVAGDTISTEDNLIVLTPVYVENEEPTPEEPTPEEPTPEEPTPEEPTPETPFPGDPVIQPPTTETSTTQTPAGPKTGDSTNPIGVIGLGILSLLGILVLTMKNKRKN